MKTPMKIPIVSLQLQLLEHLKGDNYLFTDMKHNLKRGKQTLKIMSMHCTSCKHYQGICSTLFQISIITQ